MGHDRTTRRQALAALGVAWLWDIPFTARAQTASVNYLHDDRYLLHGMRATPYTPTNHLTAADQI
jgi:hypothetical protein